jgi:hypothetical protein
LRGGRLRFEGLRKKFSLELGLKNYWSYEISKITVFFSFRVRKEGQLEMLL